MGNLGHQPADEAVHGRFAGTGGVLLATTEQKALLRSMWGTVLWEAAEREPDPEQKSLLRKAAAYMAGIP